MGKVLVLDDDAERAAGLGERLSFLAYEPLIADSPQALGRIAEEPGLAALVGSFASSSARRDGLDQLSRAQPGLPILWLADAEEATLAAVRRRGHPVWRLDWPARRSQISRLLRRAQRYPGAERRHPGEARRRPDAEPHHPGRERQHAGAERRRQVTGDSHSIRRVRALIDQVADFDTNVLITGESGTGKELVARTIHALSERADKPFVPINCGAIPEDLLESELFGHRKGAFTGAVTDRVGRFALADGGTLFLDEIGDMCLAMQVKLLRVLQERCFEQVGSTRSQSCNVRVIAATHRDLPAAVANGEFREDLFYRLNVFPIEMPCLRKRVSDLPALIDELLRRHQGEGDDRLRLSPDALHALTAYHWPGNIRELSNLVERMAILKPEGEVVAADLPAKIRDAALAGASPARAAAGGDLKSRLRALEKTLIEQAMDLSGGTTAKAARLLGLQRTTLVEKLSRLSA